jgi:hypothetical protein
MPQHPKARPNHAQPTRALVFGFKSRLIRRYDVRIWRDSSRTEVIAV